jgi:hypothetical protein
MDLTALSLPTTARGHTAILVVKCRLTRYVEIIPIHSKTERCIANALIERIYLRHGAIATVITDNGTEFVNKLSTQINALLRVKHVTTTAYAHRHNGAVENHNRTLMDQLSGYCHQFQTDWDLHLQLCAFTYNTTPNTQTGYSPHYMLYGHEAAQPHAQWISAFTTSHPDKSTAEYMSQLVSRLQFAWDYAASRLPAEREATQRVHVPLPFKEYMVHDWIYVKTHPATKIAHWSKPSADQAISAKLLHRWTGPYQITSKINPVSYRINLDGKDEKVHALNMKGLRSEYIAHIPATSTPPPTTCAYTPVIHACLRPHLSGAQPAPPTTHLPNTPPPKLHAYRAPPHPHAVHGHTHGPCATPQA